MAERPETSQQAFSDFAAEVEPKIRRALVAAFGRGWLRGHICGVHLSGVACEVSLDYALLDGPDIIQTAAIEYAIVDSIITGITFNSDNSAAVMRAYLPYSNWVYATYPDIADQIFLPGG